MSVIGEVSSVGIISALWTERDDDHHSTEGEALPLSAEAQQLFYFGKKENPRFEILPDPNGHNVFWWQQAEQTSRDEHDFQPKIQTNFALGGWSNQLRIVLRCRQHRGPNTIARERRRRMFSSVSDAQMGIPVLPPPKFRTKTAQKLQVITRASNAAGAVYVDEWEENGNYRYEIEGGVHRVMLNGFSWSWGVSNPFSVQSRSSRLAAPAPIDQFDKPLSINRFGSNSTSKVKFSNPYAIEVLFQK
ncbi:hypothetical protein JCM3765_004897 [Sporobolomyces pararoseus]